MTDDATEADDGWLAAVGFRRVKTGRPRWELRQDGRALWRLDVVEEARLLWGYDAGPFQGSAPFEAADVETRADVRELCRLLGFTLKEVPT